MYWDGEARSRIISALGWPEIPKRPALCSKHFSRNRLAKSWWWIVSSQTLSQANCSVHLGSAFLGSSLECTAGEITIPGGQNSFARFLARSLDENADPPSVQFTVSFQNLNFSFHRKTDPNGEPSINAHLLRLVDCCCRVSESLFCRRNHLLWIPGLLPCVCGIPRVHSRTSYAGLPSWVSCGGSAVWLPGWGGDRPDRRTIGHSVGSRPGRNFLAADGIHDQALALRVALYYGSSGLCARRPHCQSSSCRTLVPSPAWPGHGLCISRLRAWRSNFPGAGEFLDATLRLAPCPGDRGPARPDCALSSRDL